MMSREEIFLSPGPVRTLVRDQGRRETNYRKREGKKKKIKEEERFGGGVSYEVRSQRSCSVRLSIGFVCTMQRAACPIFILPLLGAYGLKNRKEVMFFVGTYLCFHVSRFIPLSISFDFIGGVLCVVSCPGPAPVGGNFSLSTCCEEKEATCYEEEEEE